MINKGMLQGLVAACVLLTASPALTAEKPTDKLIAQIISGEKTNRAKAKKLLDTAMLLTDQPKTCVAVLEKVIEYGLKAPVTPAAAQMAAQALGLLEEAVPDRKDEWTVLRANAMHAKYRFARGAAEKKAMAEELMKALMNAAVICEKTGQWTRAAGMYRQAAPLSLTLMSGDTDNIRQKLKAASYLATVEAKVERHTEALLVDPTKASVRASLIKALLVELDNPAKAATYLNDDVDEAWRTYIPLACKPLDDLSEAASKELGDWYRKDLAKSCSPTAKPAMLTRALGYYQQFLTLHSKDDITAISIKSIIAAIQKEIAKSKAGARPTRSSIDLLRSLDVAKYSVYGTWGTKSRVLSVAPYGGYSKIALPWMPDGSYDLNIAFTPKNSSSSSSYGYLAVMLPVGDGATVLCLGYSTPTLRYVTSSSTFPGVSRMGKLELGKSYKLEIKVVVKDDQTTIAAKLNDKPALSWKGGHKTLTPYSSWKLPETRTLGLGAYRFQIDFKQATLRMTSGRVKKFTAKKTPPRR